MKICLTVRRQTLFVCFFMVVENKPASAAVWASGSPRGSARSECRPPGWERDGTALPSWTERRSCRSWWHWTAWWSRSHIHGGPRRCWARWLHRRWIWDRPEKCWGGWGKKVTIRCQYGVLWKKCVYYYSMHTTVCMIWLSEHFYTCDRECLRCSCSGRALSSGKPSAHAPSWWSPGPHPAGARQFLSVGWRPPVGCWETGCPPPGAGSRALNPQTPPAHEGKRKRKGNHFNGFRIYRNVTEWASKRNEMRDRFVWGRQLDQKEWQYSRHVN